MSSNNRQNLLPSPHSDFSVDTCDHESAAGGLYFIYYILFILHVFLSLIDTLMFF